MMRAVTSFRACSSGVCGMLSMMAGGVRPCSLPSFQGNGLLPMLPDMVPASLMTLLQAFAPLLTAPSFRTFTALACGFLAQPGKRTVCGMLTGAGLSRVWPHDRAHWFFCRARWNADDLGLAAAVLVVFKGPDSKSRLWLARRMAGRLAAALPGRQVRVVADSAYVGGEAARIGRPGRPRVKGDRLPSLAKLAAAAEFSQVTVTRYGRTETVPRPR
jgi:hypothetical protein